jgi:hypothetical protein
MVKKHSFLGSIAGALMGVFGKAQPKPTANDLSRAEFKTSTQRLGVRFTEKIRDVYRFKWIRRASKTGNRG